MPLKLALRKGAVLSPDLRYRYLLTREWDGPPRPLTLIMLNPSTADHRIDDASSRIVMGRARRMGAGGIRIANLFAYRATNPEELKEQQDPVGPENFDYIAIAALSEPQPIMVIAAWGQHGTLHGQNLKVAAFLKRAGVELYCLGTTSDGHPKHPLRIGYDVKPVPWVSSKLRIPR